MSKRGVAYIKPQEPEFLTKLKQQAGFREGPTTETKREALPKFEDNDFDDRDEDLQPTVVVLNEGDLTAEEVDNHIRSKKEKDNKEKADLSKKILFRKPSASKSDSQGISSEKIDNDDLVKSVDGKKKRSSSRVDKSGGIVQKKLKHDQAAKLLSFDVQDDEED